MIMDRQAATEELSHKRELVNALVRRRRPLEVQAAHRGLSSPPEILTEISSLTDQIRVYEEEIGRLGTLAAQGTSPLHEVEFRALLAETWDTPRGLPSVTGVTRLELARLRLGILPEKAVDIEREVRVALSQEAFNNIEPSFFINVCSSNARSYASKSGYAIPYIESLRQLGRSIRLDAEASRQLFSVNISSDNRAELETRVLRDLLLEYNKVHQHSAEFLLFNNFLIGITADIDSFLHRRSNKPIL